MPLWLDRPSLEESRRTSSAVAKSKLTTRLEAKEDKSRTFDKAWELCKKAVDIRDKGTCRACQRKTVKTLTLCNERREHHHLVRRRKAPELLTDQRNVVVLCCACHGKATRHQLQPIGRASDMFELNGAKCLNADKFTIEWMTS